MFEGQITPTFFCGGIPFLLAYLFANGTKFKYQSFCFATMLLQTRFGMNPLLFCGFYLLSKLTDAVVPLLPLQI